MISKDDDFDDDFWNNIHELFRRRRRNMKPKQFLGFHSGGNGGAATTTEVQDRFGSDLGLSLDTSLLGMMWVQSQTSIALTPVAANGDLVGLFQDVSPNAHIAIATGDTLRPALGSDGTCNSYVTCDGTSDTWLLQNSKSCFRNMVGTTPTYSIMIKFRKGASTDGVAQFLISSRGNTSGRTGWDLTLDASNKLVYTKSTAGAPNVTMVTKTTTATYTEADGFICVVIDCNGAGVNALSIYKNNGAAETATVTAGYDQDFTDLITFFKHSNGTSPRFKGDFAQLIILKRVSTAADRTWFQTYNPARTTTLKPVNKESEYDFSNTATLFQDTAATTPATANNDPIRLAKNTFLSNMGGSLSRDAIAPDDARRPLLKTNIQNSLSGAQYDGATSNKELNFTTSWYGGGCWTFFFLLRNRNVVEGTKFMANVGGNYFTQTAEDDASNTPGQPAFGNADGEPYFVIHPGGDAIGINSRGRNDTANAYCAIVNGASVMLINSALQTKTFTITGAFSFSRLGGIVGFSNCEGDWYQCVRHSGIMSETAAKAELSTLITKWGAQPT